MTNKIMKTLKIPTILSIIALFIACGHSEKKDTNTSLENKKTESVKDSKEKSINLKQNGDYTQLYALSENCKLTSTQLAEALGYDKNYVKEKSNYEGSCWFDVIHPDNVTNNYGITLERWPNDIIKNEIKRALKNELTDIQISESRDTYITKHPTQGFLLLLNPNYTNTIKISYNYFNPKGPRLSDSQKDQRRKNTYKIANYLINHQQKFVTKHVLY